MNLALRPALDQTFSSNGGLSFDGAIDLDGKVLILSKTAATSLGTSLCIVRPAGSLLLNAGTSLSVGNTLALEGTLVSTGGAASHAWLGTVILAGSTPVINTGKPLTLSASILDSGTGGFTKTGTGTLRLSGNTANEFDGGLTMLSSATPGTTFDQLTVNGTVNLGGAALQVTALAGFTGSIGDTFMIVDNDLFDAVTGTFAGLPQGAVLSAGVFAFSISYTGGSGNDIVLTRVVPPVVPNLTSMSLSPGTGPGGQDAVTIGGTAGAGAAVTLQASTDLVRWTDVQTTAASLLSHQAVGPAVSFLNPPNQS